MVGKHRKTLEAVFADPLRSNVLWADVEGQPADTIADYVDWSRERGKEPERPYSGAVSLRITPELHRRVAAAAARAGKSINGFVAEALERVA